MDKNETLALIKLLSAIESWSFSTGSRLPDYLHERLDDHVQALTERLLNG